MSQIAPFVFIATINICRFIYSSNEERINRECEHIRHCLRKLSNPQTGIELTLEDVLNDVSIVNKMFMNVDGVVDDHPQNYRVKVSPVFRGSRNVFVKLLKFSSAFAHLFGSIEFDFEVCKKNVDDDVDSDDDADDDGFERVDVIRRCDIATFYRVVVPALKQITERADNERALATKATLMSTRTTREDRGISGEECSICLDSNLEVVAKCGHGFCCECYTRWLQKKKECAICRQKLPSLDHGGAFSIVSFSELGVSGTASTTLNAFSQTVDRFVLDESETDNNNNNNNSDNTNNNNNAGIDENTIFGQEASIAWLQSRIQKFPFVSADEALSFRKFKQSLASHSTHR
jgi:hypothetical protein